MSSLNGGVGVQMGTGSLPGQRSTRATTTPPFREYEVKTMNPKENIYDVELNSDKDRIVLWRKNRVAHVWTREQAERIRDAMIKLVPQMKP